MSVIAPTPHVPNLATYEVTYEVTLDPRLAHGPLALDSLSIRPHSGQMSAPIDSIRSQSGRNEVTFGTIRTGFRESPVAPMWSMRSQSGHI